MDRPAPVPDDAGTPETVALPAETPANAREIDRLLQEAERAFTDNRLTTPVDDNAWLRYTRVLSLSPGNEAAERGIAAIVEKYLGWALAHAEDGNLKTATRYLRTAKSVNPEHPGIESISRRIEELEASRRDTHHLPRDGLSARSAAVAAELARLARLAEARDAFVLISARTDAEGRWIYQQMNQATERRVRARLELSSRPMIRMLYKDRDG